MRIRPFGLALALILLTQSACLLSLDDVREARSIFGDADAQNDMPVDAQDMTTQLTLCKTNERVANEACTACPIGSTNSAGDDPTNGDTQCDQDPCLMTLGVTCAQFNEAYIKASNTDAGDSFGYSIALDGDTLAIGAYLESSNTTGINGDQANNNAEASGAVYVFTREDDGWLQQAYIKASNTEADDSFGYSIALNGDTLAVGAYGERSNATGSNGDQTNNEAQSIGAAYVFIRSGTQWTQQAYLKASNPEEGDSFGTSVALDGDILAVGAYQEQSSAKGVNQDQMNNNAESSGAVYVFERSNTTWSQQAYIKASNTDIGDSFGTSVALNGGTLAVGAFGEQSNATGVDGDQTDASADNSGAVYIFIRENDAMPSWVQQAYIKASNTNAEDYFGYSIALDKDTLAVGAYGEASSAKGINKDQTNNDAVASGAVYVFERTNETWSQQAYIKASNTDVGDYFGTSIALDGDTLAVGAYGEASNATRLDGDQMNQSAKNSGAAYVFTRTGNNWTQKAYLKAPNAAKDDFFGTSIALDGNTLTICADGEASNATGIDKDQTDNSKDRSGAVYVQRIEP